MSEISEKPKSWTAQICELEVDQSLYFPMENENSIRAMLSGANKGSPKYTFPDRKFKTKQVLRTDPADNKEKEVLQVTREL